MYKQEFGYNFNLGIKIPHYFNDESYSNDTCPKFIYTYQGIELFLFIEHENPNKRETENRRYNIEVFKYPDFNIEILSTEKQGEAQNLINNREKLNKIIKSVINGMEIL